jgi:hypothetical protein
LLINRINPPRSVADKCLFLASEGAFVAAELPPKADKYEKNLIFLKKIYLDKNFVNGYN